MPTPLRPLLALLAFLLVAPAVLADAPTPVPVDVADGAVVWTPDAAFLTATLAIRGPNGLEYRRAFTPGQAVTFAPFALDANDGIYIYNLSVISETTSPEGEASRTGQSQGGAFEVRGGIAVRTEMLDQVILDDLIVDGSLCVGQDCVNGETFGFDTIRIKENNLRIRAVDTSSTASFPTNDWQITFNDSSNGGQNKFSIDDLDSGRTPFTIEAGAPSHALYVDDGGNIGLTTATPVVELHIVDGDSPTVRLEQNGSSGFGSQTWDIAGNETNFFIRDATNGSRLPFKIRPSAPTGSFDIQSDGRIVATSGLFPGYTANNLSANTAPNTVFEVLGDTNLDGVQDKIARFRSQVRIDERLFATKEVLIQGDYSAQPTPFKVRDTAAGTDLLLLDNLGNLTISGVYTPTSDVNVKENIVPVDVEAILDGVVSLPMATWEYIADTRDATHLGPMAQDFAAAFGLGFNDTTIATIDADGVALAAIQGLNARAEADRLRIAELEAENDALRARLDRIEALLAAPAQD